MMARHSRGLACDAGPTDLRRLRQLKLALALTSGTMVIEAVGGYLTGSLALLSDAGHMFADVFALGLSLVAVSLALRPPTPERTYGWHRAEVLAALVNGLLLTAICALVLREAWARLRLADALEIRSTEMLLIGAFGAAINAVALALLHGLSREDINVRSDYLHVFGDLLSSVAVVFAAVLIAFWGLTIVDPLLSIGIAALVGWGAFRIIREALHILLEGVPRGVRIADVARELAAIPGVEGVHHLHAWSLCSLVSAVSVHIVAHPADAVERCAIRAQAERVLRSFGFSETTVEMDSGDLCGLELLQASGHAERYDPHHDHAH